MSQDQETALITRSDNKILGFVTRQCHSHRRPPIPLSGLSECHSSYDNDKGKKHVISCAPWCWISPLRHNTPCISYSKPTAKFGSVHDLDFNSPNVAHLKHIHIALSSQTTMSATALGGVGISRLAPRGSYSSVRDSASS